MNCAVRGLTLTFCLAFTSAGLTQSTSTEAAPAATTAAPIAHVYVGTTKGIYFYDAAATGKLTLAKATPDAAAAGLLIGVTGNTMITLGSYLVHSYQLGSTGVIGKSISSIDTRKHYGGGPCGDGTGQTNGLAGLNHQGKNVYVTFPNQEGSCPNFIQTYDISKSGELTFNGGIATGGNAGSGLFQQPTILQNDTFAYAAADYACCGGQYPQWMGYILAGNGEMQNWSFNLSNSNVTKPAGYYPFFVTAGVTNHIAAIVAKADPNNIDSYLPGQLASYTVDSHGDLSTTSTAANMPATLVGAGCCFGNAMNMSPSGKVLAVAGSGGVQVFHFNGGAPITAYSLLLTKDPISAIRWDDNNHLYALSSVSKKLYVFTVTSTLIAKVVGSPFTLPTGTPNALVVVPK